MPGRPPSRLAAAARGGAAWLEARRARRRARSPAGAGRDWLVAGSRAGSPAPRRAEPPATEPPEERTDSVTLRIDESVSNKGHARAYRCKGLSTIRCLRVSRRNIFHL